MTDAEIKQYKKIFDEFDTGKKGCFIFFKFHASKLDWQKQRFLRKLN